MLVNGVSILPQQSEMAVRNRAIKATLERAFGKGKVTVRGSRGTGYGWVSVKIDYTPMDSDTYNELERLAKQLLRKSNIDLGRTYTDDTCQYTMDKCNISLNTPRYHRVMYHDDGTMSVMRDRYNNIWENGIRQEAA
jgi:hypothetical protein